MKTLKNTVLISKILQALLFVTGVVWIYSPFRSNSILCMWVESIWLLATTAFILVLPHWIDTLMGSLMLSILSLDVWIQLMYQRAFGISIQFDTLLNLERELKASVDLIQSHVKVEDIWMVGFILMYGLLSMMIHFFVRNAAQKNHRTSF